MDYVKFPRKISSCRTYRRDKEMAELKKKRNTHTNRAKVSLGRLLPEVIASLTAAMRDGDVQAAKILLEYTIGKPKPTNDAVLELPTDKTIAEAIIGGQISVELADQAATALLKCKAIDSNKQLGSPEEPFNFNIFYGES